MLMFTYAYLIIPIKNIHNTKQDGGVISYSVDFCVLLFVKIMND
jgi:hypothetical protein